MCLSVAALVYSLEACRWEGTLQLHGFFSRATYLLLFLPGCGNVHSGQIPKLIHKYVKCYTLRLSCIVYIVLLLKPRQQGSVLRNELATSILREDAAPRNLAMSCSRYTVIGLCGFVHGVDIPFHAVFILWTSAGCLQGSIVTDMRDLILLIFLCFGLKFHASECHMSD